MVGRGRRRVARSGTRRSARSASVAYLPNPQARRREPRPKQAASGSEVGLSVVP